MLNQRKVGATAVGAAHAADQPAISAELRADSILSISFISLFLCLFFMVTELARTLLWEGVGCGALGVNTSGAVRLRMDAISFLTPPSVPSPGFAPRDSADAPEEPSFEAAMAETNRTAESQLEKEPSRKTAAPPDDDVVSFDPPAAPVVTPMTSAAVTIALASAAQDVQAEIAAAGGGVQPAIAPEPASETASPGQEQVAAGVGLDASTADPAHAALAQIATQGAKKTGTPAPEAEQKSNTPATAAGTGAQQGEAGKDSVKAATGVQNGGGEGAQGKSSNGAAKGAVPEGASASAANTAVGGNDGAFTATLEHVRAATADASAASGQHAAAHRAPPAQQIAQQIVRRMNGGGATFDLRLDPPEFGKVSVQLEVGADNKVSAMISADNPGALAELVRSARELERALNQAGFQLNERGLTFDLSDKGTQFADREGRSRPGASGAADDTTEPETPALIRASPWRAARVDLIA
jgi:flagellar hook-length control protein FliK